MTDRIKKFIAKLDTKTKEKIAQKTKALVKDPFNQRDIKKISGSKNFYRLRVGDIRVIYKITKDQVKIIDVDYRGNIY